MSVVIFDNHAFVKRLTAVGMPEAQAEVLAEQQAKLIDERLATKDNVAHLATKDNLAEFRSKTRIMDAETKTMIAQTRTAIAKTKTEVLRWLFGLIGFQTFIILGAVVALARAF